MLYDFVILLPGNSYIFYVEKDATLSFHNLLNDAIKDTSAAIDLKDGIRVARIRVASILGWYYKPHEQPIQEKMLKVVQKMAEPPEDDWKNAPTDED